MSKSIFRKLANAICVIIFLISSTISEGTSLIVYRTEQKVIVAADSRVTRADRRFNDFACKIVSTPNGIVIGTTNVATKGSIDFAEEAKKIASKHRFRNQCALDAIAKMRAEFVRVIYKTRIGPDHMKTKTETSSQAVFVGYDKNGKSVISSISLDLFWDKGDAMDIKVGPVLRGDPVPTGKYVLRALGYGDKTNQRLRDPSWNQRPEAKGVLAAFSSPHMIEDEETQRTTSRSLPESGSGKAWGTDIAVLWPGEPVAWPRRKINCEDKHKSTPAAFR